MLRLRLRLKLLLLRRGLRLLLLLELSLRLRLHLRLPLRLRLNLWLGLHLDLGLHLGLRLNLRLSLQSRLRIYLRLVVLGLHARLWVNLWLRRRLRSDMRARRGTTTDMRVMLHGTGRIPLRHLGIHWGTVRSGAWVALRGHWAVDGLRTSTGVRVRVAVRRLGRRSTVRVGSLGRGWVRSRRSGVSIVSGLVVQAGVPSVRLRTAGSDLGTPRWQILLTSARIRPDDVRLARGLDVTRAAVVYYGTVRLW